MISLSDSVQVKWEITVGCIGSGWHHVSTFGLRKTFHAGVTENWPVISSSSTDADLHEDQYREDYCLGVQSSDIIGSVKAKSQDKEG